MIAAIAYCLIVPLSLMITCECTLDHLERTHCGCDKNITIEGTILFHRGVVLNVFSYRHLAVGRAHFTTTHEGTTCSSTEVLDQIQRGEIQHGPIQWRLNWIALVLVYIQTWLIVAFFLWIFSGFKGRAQNTVRSEQ